MASCAVGVAVFSGALSSCALNQRWKEKQEALAKAKAEANKPPLFDWKGEEMSGPAEVNVLLNEQKAYIFRGGQSAGWTYLASGTASHRTPTGVFTVLEKKEQKASNTYGIIVNSAGNVVDWDAKAGRESIPAGGRFVGAPMPYWMRLTNGGIGMHAGPIPQPGMPASHGCIRLPQEMAAKLFQVVEVGTKVTISGNPPTSLSSASGAE